MKRTKDYRKIWELHYGAIPQDHSGRKYEIHHIDGNRNNNTITNLKLVTIQEHYDLHYSQGDWAACQAISRRLKLSPEENSELCRKLALKRVAEGTNPFLGPENNQNYVNERIKNGTFHLLGPDHNNKLIKEGTHNFITDHPSKIKVWCVRCHEQITRSGLALGHFECKVNLSPRKGSGSGEKNARYGTCWINNGATNKSINKEDLDQYLKKGYVKGRLPWK
jgi:hypothetical protein